MTQPVQSPESVTEVLVGPSVELRKGGVGGGNDGTWYVTTEGSIGGEVMVGVESEEAYGGAADSAWTWCDEARDWGNLGGSAGSATKKGDEDDGELGGAAGLAMKKGDEGGGELGVPGGSGKTNGFGICGTLGAFGSDGGRGI